MGIKIHKTADHKRHFVNGRELPSTGLFLIALTVAAKQGWQIASHAIAEHLGVESLSFDEILEMERQVFSDQTNPGLAAGHKVTYVESDGTYRRGYVVDRHSGKPDVFIIQFASADAHILYRISTHYLVPGWDFKKPTSWDIDNSNT